MTDWLLFLLLLTMIEIPKEKPHIIRFPLEDNCIIPPPSINCLYIFFCFGMFVLCMYCYILFQRFTGFWSRGWKRTRARREVASKQTHYCVSDFTGCFSTSTFECVEHVEFNYKCRELVSASTILSACVYRSGFLHGISLTLFRVLQYVYTSTLKSIYPPKNEVLLLEYIFRDSIGYYINTKTIKYIAPKISGRQRAN